MKNKKSFLALSILFAFILIGSLQVLQAQTHDFKEKPIEPRYPDRHPSHDLGGYSVCCYGDGAGCLSISC